MKSKNRKNFSFKKHWLAFLIGGLGLFSLTITPLIFLSSNFDNIASTTVINNNNESVDTIYSHKSRIIKRKDRKLATVMTTNHPDGGWYPNPEQSKKTNIDDVEKLNRYNETIKEFEEKKLSDEKLGTLNSQTIIDAINTNSLQKHPAADYIYNYANRLPNETQAVIKEFDMDINSIGEITTGLYAPPGEVITISFPGLTHEQIQKLNLELKIGTNENSSINKSKLKPDNPKDPYFERVKARLPYLLAKTKIDKNDFKFGNPFGGIINISANIKPTETPFANNIVKMQIDGGVETLHYIHGYTTLDEWKRLVKETRAPMMDISSDSIKFIGPKHEIGLYDKSINENGDIDYSKISDEMIEKLYPYKLMKLYDTMAMDSLYSVNDTQKRNKPVSHYFSGYVPAGEAVSFVRVWFVIAPWYWADDLLNYEKVIKNGSWGIMHENNHQHQLDWGYNSGEISNNALTIASYKKFTNVYANRIVETKDGQKQPYHNSKVDGYSSQIITNNLIKESIDKNKPYRDAFDTDYSLIMTQFGPDTFTKILRTYYDSSIKSKYGDEIIVPSEFDYKDKKDPEYTLKRHANFLYRISLITGYDFSAYAEKSRLLTNTYAEKLHKSISAISGLNNKYKPFLPINSFYASRIRYNNENAYEEIARPLEIPRNGYLFRLSDMTKTLENNNYYKIKKIKLISKPKNGSFIHNGNNNYYYTPNVSDLNQTDQFEYEVEIQDSSIISTKYKVRYLVDITLEGNTIPFVLKENGHFPRYHLPNIHKEENKIKSISTNLRDWGDKNNISQEEIDKLKDPNNNSNVNLRTNSNGLGEIHVKLNKEYSANTFKFEFSNMSGTAKDINISIVDSKTNNKIVDTKINRNSQIISTDSLLSDDFKIIFKTSNENNPTPKNFHLRNFDFYQTLSNVNEIITPQSSNIVKTNNWNIETNSGSKINNSSLTTNLKDEKIEFNFIGNGLSIFGKRQPSGGSFDLYIDNKKISTIDTNSEQEFNNEMLYISSLHNGEHNVKIVSNSNNNLQINYINLNGQTFYKTKIYGSLPVSKYILGLALPLFIFLALTIVLLTLYITIWKDNDKFKKQNEKISLKLKTIFVKKNK